MNYTGTFTIELTIPMMEHLVRRTIKVCLCGENAGKVNCEKRWKNIPARHFVYLRRNNLLKWIHKAGLHVCENYRHAYIQQYIKCA